MGLFNEIKQAVNASRNRFQQKQDVFSAPSKRLVVRNLQGYLTQPAGPDQEPARATGKTLYARFVGDKKIVSRSASTHGHGGLRTRFQDTRKNEKTRFASDLMESARWLMKFDDSNELRYAVRALESSKDFHDGKFIDNNHFRAPLAYVGKSEAKVEKIFEEKIQRMKATRKALQTYSPDALEAKMKLKPGVQVQRNAEVRRTDIRRAEQLNKLWADHANLGEGAAAKAVQDYINRVSEAANMEPHELIENLMLLKTVSFNLTPQVFDALVQYYKTLTLDRVRA